MAFSEDEAAYLRAHTLGRLATLGEDGQPDVMPVAVEYDGTHLWVGGPPGIVKTRKFRNLAAGRTKVAVVVDDHPSFDPFVARGIRIYGIGEQPFERTGMVGPGVYLRITPTVSWSWNLAGEPVGETWYPSTKTVH
ncbi:PPOX class F420-dependent oxidoreductase [Tenggerimyces flavus]|uniref:PPOX class F420-dependent oxidoreductase n=1 Tax=Tenggerimyces flavus TaxID=1708749 RepID=A0ABV7YBC7_9ACTN|nr:PPOX class F420-dependent oxidoreductase [Tenggerimyces flavus]MBM7788957.1 pyridoxamine 5'-phosphate oxidase family protein [Tenggerimyces flavus]